LDFLRSPCLSFLSLHDALPISSAVLLGVMPAWAISATTSCSAETTVALLPWESLTVTTCNWLEVTAITPKSTARLAASVPYLGRSEEHTSELQSRFDLVCRLLL